MRPKSEEIFRRASLAIPGGVNSPVRRFSAVSMSPMIAESGSGDLIRDADGREYIDFCGSWGPLILGHAHPAIVRATQEQIERGFSFGVATELEERLASKIVQLIPSIDKIRFVSSGTEAVMTALRIARGFTGRPKVIKFAGHYHGHLDSLLVQAGSGVHFLNPSASSLGVTAGAVADTLVLPFNDFDAVREVFQSEHGRQIAAIIVEPIAGNMGVVPPERGFLELLREEAEKAGALLIFDEVITGFRVGLTGAQGLYRIDPDLTCLGKIIGGGLPVAAVGGKEEIMAVLAPLGGVYQAGTLSGNPVGMRTGFETVRWLEQDLFYEHLEDKTRRLLDPIQEAIVETGANACVQRVGSMFTLFFGIRSVRSHLDVEKIDKQMFAQFFRYLFDRGIYFPPAAQEAAFVSIAHTDAHLDQTASAISQFLRQNSPESGGTP